MVVAAIVTGSAGFIGSHLCDFLLKLDEVCMVVGIDNFCPYVGLSHPESTKIKMANQTEAMANPKFQLIAKDILDVDLGLLANQIRAQTTGDVDVIIYHLAASAGVRPSIKDAKTYATNNVQVTTHLLEGAAKGNVTSVVLASSSSVYGDRPVVACEKTGVKASGLRAFHESDHTDLPISPYAATKKATELMAYTFHVNHSLPVACMRLFSVYGPRQRPDLAIHKFMTRVKEGRAIDIYGDGSMERDFTFVLDVVKGLWEAGQVIPRMGYKVWNLGNSSPIKLLDLVKAITKVTSISEPPSLNFLPVPHGDVARTCADVSEAACDLGYIPSYSLDAGLAEEWAWISTDH